LELILLPFAHGAMRLGRDDLGSTSDYISRKHVELQLSLDGSSVRFVAIGRNAINVKIADLPWESLQQNEWRCLSNGDLVSFDRLKMGVTFTLVRRDSPPNGSMQPQESMETNKQLLEGHGRERVGCDDGDMEDGGCNGRGGGEGCAGDEAGGGGSDSQWNEAALAEVDQCEQSYLEEKKRQLQVAGARDESSLSPDKRQRAKHVAQAANAEGREVELAGACCSTSPTSHPEAGQQQWVASSPGPPPHCKHDAPPCSLNDLPFPLRFVLQFFLEHKQASLPPPETLGTLRGLFVKGGWTAVRQAALEGLPRLAVVEPPPGKILSYEAKCSLETGELQLKWPRVVPETIAHRKLGSDMLIRIYIPSSEERNVKCGNGGCLKCGAADHWAKDCPVSYDFHAHKQRQLEQKATVQDAKQQKEKAIRSFLAGGCEVAGRKFAYFGAKDVGKLTEAVYFVAVAPLETSHEGLQSVEHARMLLADFRCCVSVPKMCARLELAFSGTTPALNSALFVVHDLRGQGGSWGVLCKELAAMPESTRSRNTEASREVSLVLLDDIAGCGEAGQTACDPRGDPYVMTDGNGLISVDLAEDLKQACAWKQLPLVVQKRLWYGKSLSKGTLTVCSALPVRTIVVRQSMIKVDARVAASSGAAVSGSVEGSVEVVTCQKEPNEAHGGGYLVPLLEARGAEPMVEAMLKLQREAAGATAELIQIVASGRKLEQQEAADVLRLLELNEDGDDSMLGAVQPAQMMLAGMDSTDESLRNSLLQILREKLTSVARGRFLIPDSYSLMVIPDHTASLPEGHVCVMIEGVPWKVGERVLLYKAPGMHPGDIRAAIAAAPTTEMGAHLDFAQQGQSGLIVSTLGCRSLMDMIAGSDFDGDVATVIGIAEIMVHLPLSNETPWSKETPAQSANPPAMPPVQPLFSLEGEVLQSLVLEHFTHQRTGAQLVCDMATLWKAWADEKGAKCKQAVQLALLSMEAVDSGKVSILPKIPRELQMPLPHHLRKKQSLSEKLPDAKPRANKRSSVPSALLRMWTAVKELGSSDPPDECPPILLDPLLSVYDSRTNLFYFDDDQWQGLCAKWEDARYRYNTMIRAMMRNTGYSNEAYKQIIAGFRMELVGDRDVLQPSNELFGEASALRTVVYNANKNKQCGRCRKCEASGKNDPRKFTFVWNVAGDVLLNLYTYNLNREARPGRAPIAIDVARLRHRLRPRKRRDGPTMQPFADGNDDPNWSQVDFA